MPIAKSAAANSPTAVYAAGRIGPVNVPDPATALCTAKTLVMTMTTETTIERCNWRDFIEAGDDTPADVLKALDEHFRHYAKSGTPCPGCGATLFVGADDFVGMLTATFRWGIVHGEGNCSNCGWPATVHHSIRDADGEELIFLRNYGLAAHPDFVEKRGAHGAD